MPHVLNAGLGRRITQSEVTDSTYEHSKGRVTAEIWIGRNATIEVSSIVTGSFDTFGLETLTPILHIWHQLCIYEELLKYQKIVELPLREFVAICLLKQIGRPPGSPSEERTKRLHFHEQLVPEYQVCSTRIITRVFLP